MPADLSPTQPIRDLLNAHLPEEQAASLAPGLEKLLACAPRFAAQLRSAPEQLDALARIAAEGDYAPTPSQDPRDACAHVTSAQQANRILLAHHRATVLQIAYRDVVLDLGVQRVSELLTELADTILATAMDVALRLVQTKHNERGKPLPSQPPPVVAIAFGRYGGCELDYSQRLDVIFLADMTSPNSALIANAQEFVDHWLSIAHSILQPPAAERWIYQLHQRLQLARSPHRAYYDAEELSETLERSGRTWHRQAFVKARAAAGDTGWGRNWIAQRQSWIYRRYLGTADQAGIRAAKHKLRRMAAASEPAEPGTPLVRPLEASQEIESVTQFLQLLNGTDLPEIRVANTVHAIEALEQTGYLTMQERSMLSENYGVLKRLGHRLQLASAPEELEVPHAAQPNAGPKRLDESDVWNRAALGLRLQHADGTPDPQPLQIDAQQRHQVGKRIVDHLVHDVFPDADELAFETEMVLDPDVDAQAVTRTLSGYGFKRPELAFHHLLALAAEPIRFLSDRRSRHFLAGIAPNLLREIAATPDPDATLARLVEVSDSLGGKAALWELFQLTPSTLRMGVRLCAVSPYLTGILTHHPGMIDELIDSLLLDRLPSTEHLDRSSRELCRFAEDITPILHSFKNSAHLRIGTRDLLGRDAITETHRALADTAESCLKRVAEDAWQQLTERYGDPLDEAGNPCRLTMLALGKLGAQEPNYHSDLDVLFLYDAEGHTQPRTGARRPGTSNSHFFNELTQRISKRFGHHGSSGRLYELDARIRFTHLRQTLAVSVAQFAQHFADGNAALWQRLALVGARVIAFSETSGKAVQEAIRNALLQPAWHPAMATEASHLRAELEQGASAQNLKRGPGGTLDIEIIVQLLLLRHAEQLEGELGVGTLAGIELLKKRQWLSSDRAQQLTTAYKYLRRVESYLRLMNLPARHDLPHAPHELRQLAYAMRETAPMAVATKCEAYRDSNRRIFNEIIAEQSRSTRD